MIKQLYSHVYFILVMAAGLFLSGCGTASEQKFEKSSIEDQKQIFIEAKAIYKRQSCEAAIDYLAELTLMNSSKAAGYLDPVLVPSVIKHPQIIPLPVHRHVISRSEIDQNYNSAIAMFRQHVIYVVLGNNITDFKRVPWPLDNVNYSICSEVKNAKFCETYARQQSFSITVEQARLIWNGIKKHSDFNCRKTRRIRKY